MKIEVLYPEIASLYGDIMNIRYLSQCLPEAEIIQTPLGEEPLFAREAPSMIYMGPMTERSQKLAAERLLPYRDRLAALIEEKTVFLITGNALELFGTAIQREDGSSIRCLEIFPYIARQKMFPRYNSLYLGKMGDAEIMGFKNQFSHIYGEIPEAPLFETLRGAGRNPEVQAEGILKNNFMATYLLGPLLVINPPFMQNLLERLGVSDRQPAHFAETETAYQKRLSEFQNPKTKF